LHVWIARRHLRGFVEVGTRGFELLAPHFVETFVDLGL
jgi:hypothetical protein